MVGSLSAAIAVQVKERVVGQVAYGSLIGGCPVMYLHGVFVGKGVSNLDFQITGKSLFPVGREIREVKCLCVDLAGFPYDFIISFDTPMQGAIGII